MTETVINGNEVDLSNAALYRRIGSVTVKVLTEPKQYVHDWGVQDMVEGDLELWDEIGGTRGCERQAFNDTYEPDPDNPGRFRKSSLIRAVQMFQPFTVLTRDSEVPVRGDIGDWLVENVTTDGRPDRYKITNAKFVGLYITA